MNAGRMHGRTSRVAACLALVLALTGCMQLNLGLTVNADDTVDGQLLLTARKSLLTSTNKAVPAAFAELRQNIPTLPAGEETVYEDASHYGAQIAYRKIPLKDFTSESVKIVKDGDLHRFTLPLDPTRYGGKVAEQNPQNKQTFMKLMSFEISVTFPGRVIDTNGTVNGRSVSWQVPANRDKPTELKAVAEAPPAPSGTRSTAADRAGNSFPWLLVLGGVVVLLLIAVVVVILLRRPSGPVQGSGHVPAGT